MPYRIKGQNQRHVPGQNYFNAKSQLFAYEGYFPKKKVLVCTKKYQVVTFLQKLVWTNFTKFRPFPPGLYSKERESKSFFRKWAVALLRVFLQTAASDRDAIKPLLAICFRTGLPLLDLFRFLCPLMMHDICYYFNSRHLAYATDVVQVHL